MKQYNTVDGKNYNFIKYASDNYLSVIIIVCKFATKSSIVCIKQFILTCKQIN